MSYGQRGRSRHFTGARTQSNRMNVGTKIQHLKYINQAVAPAREEVYEAKHTFADFNLHPHLLRNILAHGYNEPMPIQDQAMPILLSGQDVVGIANTGTGKTAAFLIPFIHKVMENQDEGVLILAPTRELAIQINAEFKAFAKGLPLSICLAIGGTSLGSQIAHLQQNPHFVIGTPGRIKDLVNRGAFNTEMFTNVVLDEVDRMLDIGFRQDIKYLVSRLPKNRQCAFFSATVNRDTEEIMAVFLNNPATVSVKKRETNHHIHQDIIKVEVGQNKIDILHDLLQQIEFRKVIVFGKTKHGINKLEMQLSARGVRVSSIHGNKTQNARQYSLQAFKQGKVQALLATDIAARGIDIEDVTHVINYDEPASYEDYVHRIGRTGRAGKTGQALTFVK